MNGSFARRVFSASTTALAVRRSRPLPFLTRPYSDQKSKPEDVSESAPEPENSEVSVESQILENLKKKEAEAHDLTVSLSFLPRTLAHFALAESTTVPPGRLSEPPTQCCSRKGAATRLCDHPFRRRPPRNSRRPCARPQIRSPRCPPLRILLVGYTPLV